jgi:hypothetical protein
VRRCRSRDCFLNPPFSKTTQILEIFISTVNPKMPIRLNFFNVHSMGANHRGKVRYTLKTATRGFPRGSLQDGIAATRLWRRGDVRRPGPAAPSRFRIRVPAPAAFNPDVRARDDLARKSRRKISLVEAFIAPGDGGTDRLQVSNRIEGPSAAGRAAVDEGDRDRELCEGESADGGAARRERRAVRSSCEARGRSQGSSGIHRVLIGNPPENLSKQ